MTAAARAWVDHLRAGGTTAWVPWREAWTDPAPAATGDATGATTREALPGAQQLELLRRLNSAGRPAPTLVARVLGASPPGRGIPDLELVGAARDTRFGPRPIDPADLADDELVRLAGGLLAEDLVALGPPAPDAVRPPWPWRRRYRVVGDPWVADHAREQLVRRGRPPGGNEAVVHVLGADLVTMLRHVWVARACEGTAPPWHPWVERVARTGRLPHRADPVAMAGFWAARVGPERVRVVLDAPQLAGLLGLRRTLSPAPEPGAHAVELTRGVAAALGLLVLPEARTVLLRRRWVPRVAVLAEGGVPAAVPADLHERVAARAAAVRDDLLAAGYPVVGHPDLLLPGPAPAGEAVPTDSGVLALALRVLLEHPGAATHPQEVR